MKVPERTKLYEQFHIGYKATYVINQASYRMINGRLVVQWFSQGEFFFKFPQRKNI